VEDALASVPNDDDVVMTRLVMVSVYGAGDDGRPFEETVSVGVGMEGLPVVIV
jgi:hypothetical protein